MRPANRQPHRSQFVTCNTKGQSGIVRVGIISDTHDQLTRTGRAIEILRDRNVGALLHCGDLIGPEMIHLCSSLPFYFVFGNWDADFVPQLSAAAEQTKSNCLCWAGEICLAGRRIALVHGHLSTDTKKLLNTNPDYLCSGHSHVARDVVVGHTRRINPGALHDAESFSVAVLDLLSDTVEFVTIPP